MVNLDRPSSLNTASWSYAYSWELIRDNFNLTPAGIIEKLNLRRPQFRQVATYGHFGRTDLDVAWEKTDMAETLREQAGR